MKVLITVSLSLFCAIIFAGTASASSDNFKDKSIRRDNFRSLSGFNSCNNCENAGFFSGILSNNFRDNIFNKSSYSNNRNVSRFDNFNNARDNIKTDTFTNKKIDRSDDFGEILRKKADSPKTVAYYETGLHGIADEPGVTHEGQDLVQKLNKKGDFIQFFNGVSSTEGQVSEISFWKEQNDKFKNSQNKGFVLVQDAFPEWGDYLQPNTDYLVKTIDIDRIKK